MKPLYRRDLYQLLKDIPNAVVVEVGVAEGLFASDLMRWGIKKLFLVDMWESMPAMHGDASNPQDWHDYNYKNTIRLMEENKKPHQEYELLRGPSHQMAKLINVELDLVNVDADHSYEGVRRDQYAFWPLLKSGGIMAFHDAEMEHYGVKRAVHQFAQEMGVEINLLPEDKIEDAGAYLVKP